jgi:uncharacterized membrane protein
VSVDRWSLVRFLHVTAAMCWVGGQLVLSGVVLPVLRSNLDPTTRAPLIHATARRFALIADVVVLPVALGTGVALAWHRGVTPSTLTGPGYGRLLAIKLVLVVLSIVLATVHGILATRHPRTARPLAIGGLGVSLGIVVFATALVP